VESNLNRKIAREQLYKPTYVAVQSTCSPTCPIDFNTLARAQRLYHLPLYEESMNICSHYKR
jgi:hypothetical protein